MTDLIIREMWPLNLISFHADNEEFEKLVKKSELKFIIFFYIKKGIAK